MVATRKPPSQSAPVPIRQVRCAIYCRKSNTEGLDGDFSSLDAQRDACSSYIQSQAGLGWMLVPERYEDGGFSGGTMDRPALTKLLGDIEAGHVDCIVLYRLDRLSRSLIDFAKIAEILDRHDASFVSVTESFSTATSTGRLHLHMILAFAQYERELAAERIRDKIAGAKRRGKHCGGMPILGYDTDRVMKRLVVNAEEAKLVVRIFERFAKLGSVSRVAEELNAAGYRTKSWPTSTGRVPGGKPWHRGNLYKVLNNVKYLGLVPHKGQMFPGEHNAIVPQKLWDQAHAILRENYPERASRTRGETPALLRGVIKCGHCNCSMGPTFTRKNGRTYRFYLCVQAAKRGYKMCPIKSVAAGAIEAAVIGQLRTVIRTPELVARTYREAKAREAEEIERLRAELAKLENLRAVEEMADPDLAHRLEAVAQELQALETHPITEKDVVDALERLDPVWESLFPNEQARIVQLLVERVEVHEDGIQLRLRTDGLRSLVAELTAPKEQAG